MTIRYYQEWIDTAKLALDMSLPDYESKRVIYYDWVYKFERLPYRTYLKKVITDYELKIAEIKLVNKARHKAEYPSKKESARLRQNKRRRRIARMDYINNSINQINSSSSNDIDELDKLIKLTKTYVKRITTDQHGINGHFEELVERGGLNGSVK